MIQRIEMSPRSPDFLYKRIEKFLGTSGVWKNDVPSSYIHGGLHHEFNERTPP